VVAAGADWSEQAGEMHRHEHPRAGERWRKQEEAAAVRVDRQQAVQRWPQPGAPRFEIGRDGALARDRRIGRGGAEAHGHALRRAQPGLLVGCSNEMQLGRVLGDCRREQREDVGVELRRCQHGTQRLAESCLVLENQTDPGCELRLEADRDVHGLQHVARLTQQAAPDRRLDAPFLGAQAIARAAPRAPEQRHVPAGRVEGVAVEPEVERCDEGEAERDLAEQVKVQLGNVEASQAAAMLAHVDRTRILLERAIDHVTAARATQIGKAARWRAGDQAGPCRAASHQRRIEAVRRAAEPAEGFDHDAVPAGDVAHQSLEHGHRALAAAIEDGARDIGAPAAAVERVQQPCADQLADIGQRPVVGGLGELVLPQPVDAAPRARRLRGYELDQAAQRVRVHGHAVLVPVDSGDPFPELLGVVAFEAVARRHAMPQLLVNGRKSR
jgi:hypothetical protein